MKFPPKFAYVLSNLIIHHYVHLLIFLTFLNNSCIHHVKLVVANFDAVDSDDTIAASDVQLGRVSGPSEGGGLWWLGLLFSWDDWDKLGFGDSSSFVVQVENGNFSVKGSSQPFELVVESQVIDLRGNLVGSVGLSKVSIVPDLDFLVSSSGSEVSGVGGKGKSVDVVWMGLDGSVKLEQLAPDLESSVSSD